MRLRSVVYSALLLYAMNVDVVCVIAGVSEFSCFVSCVQKSRGWGAHVPSTIC